MIQIEILVLINCIYVLRFSGMGYKGAHGVAALHRYKYSGVDHSYVAKYVLQPFWSRFVHFFPLWMPYVSSSFFLHYIFCSFFFFWVMIITHCHLDWNLVFFKNVISVKIMKSCFQNAISKGVIIVYMLTTVYTLSHGLKSCFFKTSSLLHTLIEYTLPCGLKSCF